MVMDQILCSLFNNLLLLRKRRRLRPLPFCEKGLSVKEYKSTYLYERKYKINYNEKYIINDEKRELATGVLGKSFLNKLCENVEEVCSYLHCNEYEVLDSCPQLYKESTKLVMDYSSWDIEVAKKFLSENKNINFNKFYVKYLAWGSKKLRLKVDNWDICSSNIIIDYFKTLVNKLQKVCIRILILEIQMYKNSGLLNGNDIKEEYQFFVNEIMDEQFQINIEEKYPLVVRSIGEVISSCSCLYSHAINRLLEDKDEIEAVICNNISFTKLDSIIGDISDSHCGGKSVLKLNLNNGKQIIYKPHSVNNEKCFNEFAYNLGNYIGIKMYKVSIIDRHDYGWVECIENIQCTSEEQVYNYYIRMGAYILIFYLLGTNDIHNENIIACGEYPVVIDLENIIGFFSTKENIEPMDKVLMFLENSVLNLGVLPSFKWNIGGANVNISGLGGKGHGELPFQIPRIAFGNTSNIKIEYYYPSLELQENMPVLNGNRVNPNQYLGCIIQGFEKAYSWVVQNKNLVKGFLRTFEKLESRYLLADTQRYTMCLNSSYNPLLMDDGGKRQLYLYTMWYGRDMDNPLEKKIVNSEIEDLLQHDIPYFYFKVSGKELYNSRGEAIGEYFDKVPFEELLEKVEALNKQDMNHQLKLIEMTVSLQEKVDTDLTNEQIDKNKIPKDIFVSREQFFSIAKKIGCHILNNAISFKNGDIGWYTANVTTRGEFSWKIQPTDMYLYGGVMGISMYLHKLNYFYNDTKYRHTCEVLSHQLFDYTDNMLSKEDIKGSTGLYSGEASLLYGYLHIYHITKEIKYLEYAEKHARIVKQCMSREENFDLLDGLAGAVVGLMELYAVKNSEEILEAAAEGGNKLLDCAVLTPQGMCWKNRLDDVPLLGISHGTAGIMIAFAKLYEATGQEKYYDAMAASLAYENANYDDELNNWIDFRANPDKRKEADTVAWCHGAGGILMSRLAILNVVKDKLKDVVCRDIERAVSKLEDKWMREGLCLCHGSCGNLLMLKKYADVMEDKEMKKRILEYAGQLASLIEKEEWLLQEKYNPGLMNGYTGVGMSMLMLSEIFREDETKIIT